MPVNDSVNEVINIHLFYHCQQLRLSEQTVDYIQDQAPACLCLPIDFSSFISMSDISSSGTFMLTGCRNRIVLLCIRVWKCYYLIVHKMPGG
jgi:hypothetical protein